MIAPATSDVLAVIVAVLATIAPLPSHIELEPSPPPLDDSGGITYTILHLHPIDDNKIITI